MKFRHPARLLPALFFIASLFIVAMLFKAGVDPHLLFPIPLLAFLIGALAAWLKARRSE
jgi:hypothetical protein